MFAIKKKKAPHKGGALGVEAGFIQARNLSSSELIIRNHFPAHKPLSKESSLCCKWVAGVCRIAVAFAFSLYLLGSQVMGEPQHGIAMHGIPALAESFEHLPYVNPNAPQGGQAVFGETGGFDSLNPFVLRGTAPWQVSAHTVETLMARSYDEPFTLYGLLAETVETPPDRSWVEFTLRPEARFSDGTPVQVEDVLWSFETLGTKGHPRYRNSWAAISGLEQTGERSVRITFNEPNRELPLILGLRPVLKKAQWEGKDFERSSTEAVIGSGPYIVEDFELGRSISFKRNPDWWGQDLPINRGLNNFETLKYEYFRNGDALWGAVKAGQVSLFTDADPVRWVEGYDFQTIRDELLKRGEITHQRPSGMRGFVFNTRRPLFTDRRVREALSLSFDWAWINERLFRGQYERIESYFGNSPLAAKGPAEGQERKLLKPFAAELPDGTLDKMWRAPESDGSGRDRRNLRKAGKLLDAAGWSIVDGKRQNAKGEEFHFEVLVGSTEDETMASLWRDALQRLGITLDVRRVDDAQYRLRRQDYDYDITVNRWAMSLSPGIEQRLYFASAGRENPGTRNYMGVADPVVDAMIDALLSATSNEKFVAAVRALDRVLSAGIYVIPFGTLPTDRVVWQKGLNRPEAQSLYGWWGWWAGPAVWWREAG